MKKSFFLLISALIIFSNICAMSRDCEMTEISEIDNWLVDKQAVKSFMQGCIADGLLGQESEILEICQKNRILDKKRCKYAQLHTDVLSSIDDENCTSKKEWLSISPDTKLVTRNMILLLKNRTAILIQGTYPKDGGTVPPVWKYFIEKHVDSDSFYFKDEWNPTVKTSPLKKFSCCSVCLTKSELIDNIKKLVTQMAKN